MNLTDIAEPSVAINPLKCAPSTASLAGNFGVQISSDRIIGVYGADR